MSIRAAAVRAAFKLTRPSPSQLVRCLSNVTAATPTLAKPSPPTSAPSATPRPKVNSVSPEEIALFSSLATEWWNPTGEFALLHRMNDARIKFVRESILRERELPVDQAGGRWLTGTSVLDVGCGGGIFSEALARLGATAVGVDASGANIAAARHHASLDPSFAPASPTRAASKVVHNLEYRHCAAEDLVTEGKVFDVVCAMEVIEHVEDAGGFLECLIDLTKPGGLLLLSTISRTPLAHLLDITMVEQVMRIVTPGTHTYSKFIKPSELREYFAAKGWEIETRGCIYNPLSGGWVLLGPGEYGGMGELVNYFVCARKAMTSP